MKTDAYFEVEENNIDEIKKSMEAQIKTALEECGLVAERYAINECPVVTGRLRASITHAVKGSDGGTHQYQDDSGKAYAYEYGAVGDENSMYLGTNVEYAPYIEEGGNGRTPRHFLKHAIENHTDEYYEIIQRHLGDLK